MVSVTHLLQDDKSKNGRREMISWSLAIKESIYLKLNLQLNDNEYQIMRTTDYFLK